MELSWVVFCAFNLSKGSVWRLECGVLRCGVDRGRCRWVLHTISTNVELHDAQCGSGIYAPEIRSGQGRFVQLILSRQCLPLAVASQHCTRRLSIGLVSKETWYRCLSSIFDAHLIAMPQWVTVRHDRMAEENRASRRWLLEGEGHPKRGDINGVTSVNSVYDFNDILVGSTRYHTTVNKEY